MAASTPDVPSGGRLLDGRQILRNHYRRRGCVGASPALMPVNRMGSRLAPPSRRRRAGARPGSEMEIMSALARKRPSWPSWPLSEPALRVRRGAHDLRWPSSACVPRAAICRGRSGCGRSSARASSGSRCSICTARWAASPSRGARTSSGPSSCRTATSSPRCSTCSSSTPPKYVRLARDRDAAAPARLLARSAPD
jgi:hypothetical protein